MKQCLQGLCVMACLLAGFSPLAVHAGDGAGAASCPLAHEAYSSRTVLLDLLIDPAAHGVLERMAPAVLRPPFGPPAWPTQVPTFAAILTPAELLGGQADGAARIAALDRALSKITVTPAAVRARCARYDTVAPALPSSLHHPAMLIFEKITGFKDTPSVEAARAALEALARRHGWQVFTTDNGAVMNAADLRRFDVVVWNNVSGDALTLPQRAAFRRWLESGGGFAGIHGTGGDPIHIWDWYTDTLIGAAFKGHPAQPQFQSARVVLEDPANPGQEAGSWTLTEEWYSFKSNPRAAGVQVLARLDESTYAPMGLNGLDLRMGDHPIAWRRCIGRGRSFYTAIGHRPEVYDVAQVLALLEQGVTWAAGQGPASCAASGGNTQ